MAGSEQLAGERFWPVMLDEKLVAAGSITVAGVIPQPSRGSMKSQRRVPAEMGEPTSVGGAHLDFEFNRKRVPCKTPGRSGY